MKFIRAATFILLIVVTIYMMWTSDNPKKNLLPVKRYKVTVVTDAPGPWDSVNAIVFFDITDEKCVRIAPVIGSEIRPDGIDQEIEMTRVNENTWEGYFYRDLVLDENYYGRGVCHWDATQVAPHFVVHGESFGTSVWTEDALHKGPQVAYFRNSDYWDRSYKTYVIHDPSGSTTYLGGGAQDFSTTDPKRIQRPNDFFPITVTVKEARP